MNREVKEYRFSNVSATNSGNVALTNITSFPIKGQIEKITWKSGNIANNGSLFILTSGGSHSPDELLVGIKQCSGNRTFYPRNIVVDSGGSALDDTANKADLFIVDNHIYMWGSGCGASKSGLNISIYYR